MSDDIKPGSKYAERLGCKCRVAKDDKGNDAYAWGHRVWIVDKGCVIHSLAKPRVRDKKNLH